MSQPALSILIPAAGASQRLGQAKQLVEYKGSSLLQNAVNSAHSITPDEIIVVTGANKKAVMAAVQNPTVRWIHNPHWPAGMGGSIARGADAIGPESSGMMILLCDQWRIQAPDLQVLQETWRADPRRIVCAEAAGHYMPPVIFPASCFNQLRDLEGDRGARSLLDNNAELLTPVPMKNAAFDLDTPAQLNQLK
jgi:molybdenum cofactor cytidylyltransferase